MSSLRYGNCESSTPAAGADSSRFGANVVLSGLACEVVESMSRATGLGAEETIERAVGRYLRDRELAPPGWICLPLPEEEAPDDDPSPLQVGFSKATGDELGSEAVVQGVSLDALVSHAVMYAWAAERKRRSG